MVRTHGVFFRIGSVVTAILFFSQTLMVPLPGYAQAAPAKALISPRATQPSHTKVVPCILHGVLVDPQNPLRFDFIVDPGDKNLQGEALKQESLKLVKYFLSALTLPKTDQWVNLSPNDKDRIIPDNLGVTDMGRDMLEQDYLLKQMTSQLSNPDQDLGKVFWTRVYRRAQEQFGTTIIPINTYNRVWIVPDKAVVYEGGRGAYVGERHLKVMLEADYLASRGQAPKESSKEIKDISAQIVREVLIPELEREVNEGASFTTLRQIYNSMILAVWYKQRLREGFLGQLYVDKAKVAGIDTADKAAKDKVYAEYMQTFEKGVYNFIREDLDPQTQRKIPRKYFSGGLTQVETVAILPQAADPAQGKPESGAQQELQMTVDLATAQATISSPVLAHFEQVSLPPAISTVVDTGGRVMGTLLPFEVARSEDDWGNGNFRTMRMALEYHAIKKLKSMVWLAIALSGANNSPYSQLSELLIDPKILSPDWVLENYGHYGELTQAKSFIREHEGEIKQLNQGNQGNPERTRQLVMGFMRAVWADIKDREIAQVRAFVDSKKVPNIGTMEDHTLFWILKEQYMAKEDASGVHWSRWRSWHPSQWDSDIQSYEQAQQDGFLDKYKEKNREELDFRAFVQMELYRQLGENRDFAQQNGITIKLDQPYNITEASDWILGDRIKVSNLTLGVPAEPAYPMQYWQFGYMDYARQETEDYILARLKYNIEMVGGDVRFDYGLGIFSQFGFVIDREKKLTMARLGAHQELTRLAAEANRIGTEEAKRDAEKKGQEFLIAQLLKMREQLPPDLQDVLLPDTIPLLMDAQGQLNKHNGIRIRKAIDPRFYGAAVAVQDGVTIVDLRGELKQYDKLQDDRVQEIMQQKGRWRSNDFPKLKIRILQRKINGMATELILIDTQGDLSDLEMEQAAVLALSPWVTEVDVVQGVVNNQQKQASITVTDDEEGGKGSLYEYMFSGVMKPTDLVQLAYYKRGPGEPLVTRIIEMADAMGHKVFFEILGLDADLLAPNAEQSGAKTFNPSVYGSKAKWGDNPGLYHPAYHKPGQEVFSSLHDTMTDAKAYESDFSREDKEALLNRWNLRWNLGLNQAAIQKLLELNEYTPEIMGYFLRDYIAESVAQSTTVAFWDLVRQMKEFRLNRPGSQTGQWVDRLIPEVRIEMMLAAARGNETTGSGALVSVEAREADALVTNLLTWGNRIPGPVNVENGKVLHVTPMVGTDVQPTRELGESLVVTAIVQGSADQFTENSIVVRDDEGREQIAVLFAAPIDFEHSDPDLPRTISRWSVRLFPTHTGVHQFTIRTKLADGRVQESEPGSFHVVEKGTQRNRLSPEYKQPPALAGAWDVTDFVLSPQDMERVAENFDQHMQRGSTGQPSSLKMLNSHLGPSTGRETGTYIAIDWGGTNFRAMLVELTPGQEPVVTQMERMVFTDDLKTGSREALLEALVAQIKKLNLNPQQQYSLGFTLGFATEQTQLNKGKLREWVKGWDVQGMVGQDIVELLQTALNDSGLANVKIVALLNDTVGTHLTVPGASVGMILGTGFNFTTIMDTGEIINAEAGGFGAVPQTAVDKELFAELKPLGDHAVEKMVSGAYLGDIVRRSLRDSHRQGVFLPGATVPALEQVDSFSTTLVSQIDGAASLEDVRILIQLEGSLGLRDVPLRDEDLRQIKTVVGDVSLRAGRLIAAMLITAIRSTDQDILKEHTVAVDGSVYEHHPNIPRYINEAMGQLVGIDQAKRIKLVLTKDGSGIGAAVAAAVATSKGIMDNAPGGIDLNPDQLNLQIRRDTSGMPLPMPQQPIGTMTIDGFIPVIINTVPVNAPFFLGDLMEVPKLSKNSS